MIQYLLTPPHSLAQARTFGLPLGHMAFSVGPDGHLRHPGLPPDCRKGLMLVGIDAPPDTGSDPRQTVQEILSLCRSRTFGGVILDLECPPSPFLARLIRLLEEGLRQGGRGLFLPASYSAYSDRAFLYLSSALSGGCLQTMLEEAVRQYGADRLVLSLSRVREDFFLPAPTGSGRPLTQEALETQLRDREPCVFFSQALCAYYFTYMSRETGAHFVLFDTGESLEKKRDIAASLGISCVFWAWPEIADLPPAALVQEGQEEIS